jgi:serine protease AprX
MRKRSKLGRLMLVLALVSLVAVVALGPAVAFAGETKPQGREEGPAGQSAPIMDRDGNKIFDRLDKLVGAAGPQDKISVIAVFDKMTGADKLRGPLGNFKVNQTYTNFPFLAMDLTPGQITALSKLPFVKQIEYDEPVTICMETASNWFGATKARTDFGVTGDKDGNPATYSKNDIVVAVIDTGIDPNHVDLDGGKIIAWKDYVNNQATAYDDHGHGTHCAGIATGEGHGNAIYKGVAPGAALIGLKVLNAQGSGTTSNIQAAVDWCITNKATYNIRVISMSLGSSGSSNGTDSLSLAVNNAAANGIVPVVAAGNSGPAKYTIGAPAAAADAITIGAMADCGEAGFSLASFSSRGPTADNRVKPDLSAPGVNIMAAKSGSTNLYQSMSGTSMATPFAAGTVALMLAANPNLTPTQVKSILESTSIDWSTVGKDIDFGSGRLDAYQAIRQAGSYTGTGPAVPAHELQSGNLSATGAFLTYNINVTSTSYPIALTLIMTNWASSSPDFDLYLYNPSGAEVAKSTGSTRQDTVGYTPTVTGTYQAKVISYAGSGPFTLDISAGLGVAPDNPPTASIANPAASETVSGTYTVRVQASDDKGVSKVEVQIDTGTWVDVTATLSGGYYTYSWNTTTYADGAHTVNARATDTIGQTGTDSHACTVNNTVPVDNPPTASVANPLAGETVSGTYAVKVQATDDKGVSKVEVQIDTGTWVDVTATLSGGYYTYSWNTTTYANGAHTVNTRATDTINQTATDSHACTVSNTSATVHTLNLTGTVTSAARDANFYFNVTSGGYIFSTLNWGTAADLDFYVYAPNGTLINQAYTTSKPETLRSYTDTYGPGVYRIRVNLYSGVDTSFTLAVDGYQKKTWTGAVDLLTPNSWVYVASDYTGSSLFRLDWPSSLTDLDFYVYDPGSVLHGTAYTILKPETLWVTIDQTGTWSVKVTMYTGISSTYTLDVYVPEDNLSQ